MGKGVGEGGKRLMALASLSNKRLPLLRGCWRGTQQVMAQVSLCGAGGGAAHVSHRSKQR
jgi:hypothetical protein